MSPTGRESGTPSKAAVEVVPFAIIEEDFLDSSGDGRSEQAGAAGIAVEPPPSTGKRCGRAEQAGAPVVIVETDDMTPIVPAVEPVRPPSPQRPPPRRQRIGTYAIASLAICLVLLLLESAAEWVQEQFRRADVLGLVVVPFIFAAVFFSIWWLWGEISSWRRLVVADRLRNALSEGGQAEADRVRFMSALRHLAVTMEEPHRSAVAAVLSNATERRGADELQNILDLQVIHPMDDVALSAIHRAARDSLLLGLVSPTLLTDTAAFLVRAIGMIQAVAAAYGHRPGKLGLYSLIRRMLADIAILSGVMIVARHALQALGRAVGHGTRVAAAAGTAAGGPHVGVAAGVVGGAAAGVIEAAGEEAADAVAAAARMAQLGLLAIAVSRPLALSDVRKSELSSELRKMIIALRPKRGPEQSGQDPAIG